MRWIAVAVALVGGRAHADDPAPSPATGFLSSDLAAGALLKAQLAAGWGRPQATWVGGEALAITTSEFGAEYAGAHANLVFLDATLGVRRTEPYARAMLPVAGRYTSLDGTGSAPSYTTFDATLTGYAPVPGGYAMLWVDLVTPLGLASDRRIFEEYERVVVGSGVTTATRLTYLVKLDGARLLAGPTVEGVWMGGRSARAWRIGGAVSWTISARWSLEAMLTTPIVATDDLGAWDGLWGTAGVHFRWASVPRHDY